METNVSIRIFLTNKRVASGQLFFATSIALSCKFRYMQKKDSHRSAVFFRRRYFLLWGVAKNYIMYWGFLQYLLYAIFFKKCIQRCKNFSSFFMQIAQNQRLPFCNQLTILTLSFPLFSQKSQFVRTNPLNCLSIPVFFIQFSQCI